MKIAFFDIDGTLINAPTGLLGPTQKTIDALISFQKQGNLIFIASARGVLPIPLQAIPFDGIVGNDGHYIRYKDEIWVNDLFNEQDIKQLLQTYKKYNGHAMFSGHTYQYCDCWDNEYVQKHNIMFNHTNDRPNNLIENIDPSHMDAIASCVLFETVEDLYNAYHELEDNFSMVVYDTGLIRMDIYKKGFSKGTACKYVYEKLDIPKENTYAFGDGINDVEMLELVGHGIAMGNAIEKLKDVADEITDSVLADGIANYFHEKLLIL